jgi:arsenate reductase
MSDNREPTRVLFLCTHNSARSQMAEGYLRATGEGRFETMSAGIERRPVHPLAIRAMAEIGVDIRHHIPKLWVGLIRDRWDWVITVCDAAYEQCPTFPGRVQRAHWSLPDPSDTGGDEEEKLAVFRKIRDEIVDRLNAWRAERDREMGPEGEPRGHDR